MTHTSRIALAIAALGLLSSAAALAWDRGTPQQPPRTGMPPGGMQGGMPGGGMHGGMYGQEMPGPHPGYGMYGGWPLRGIELEAEEVVIEELSNGVRITFKAKDPLRAERLRKHAQIMRLQHELREEPAPR